MIARIAFGFEWISTTTLETVQKGCFMVKKFVMLVFFSCTLVVGCSGKQNQRSVTMNYEQLSTKIHGLTVKNTEGGDVVLESLWQNRQVVLAFLRHFG